MTDLTLARLREILHYDPLTGEWKWLVPGKGRRKNPGHPTKSRYCKIKIAGKYYSVQRLAWFYMMGEWPSQTVDHRNRIKTDNRWCNFRDVSLQENLQNNGAIGVYWRESKQHWRVIIRRKEYGTFKDKEEAMNVVMKLRKDL